MSEWRPVKGEMVEVSDKGDYWYRYKFFAYADGAGLPWLVWDASEKLIYAYEFARPIQKEEEIQLYDVVESIQTGVPSVVIKFQDTIFNTGERANRAVCFSENGITSIFELHELTKLSNKMAVAPGLYTDPFHEGAFYETPRFPTEIKAKDYCEKRLKVSLFQWPSAPIDFRIVDREER